MMVLRGDGHGETQGKQQWREQFLAGGQTALKSRAPDDVRDDEIHRLRAKVGEITMNNELLLERSHRLEANPPFDLYPHPSLGPHDFSHPKPGRPVK